MREDQLMQPQPPHLLTPHLLTPHHRSRGALLPTVVIAHSSHHSPSSTTRALHIRHRMKRIARLCSFPRDPATDAGQASTPGTTSAMTT